MNLETARQWGSWILQKLERLPLIGPMLYFRSVHRRTYKEAIFLWLLGSLPVVFTIAFKGGDATSLFGHIRNEFSLPSQFIYAATFLAPVLAITFLRLLECEDGLLKGVRTLKLFPGHWIIFLLSLLILFATAAAYAIYSISPKQFGEMIYTALLGRYSWVIYLLSVYFWYISLLDNRYENPDFGATMRRDEDVAGETFRNRMNQ